MAILPKGETVNTGVIGGSPRGWTFISRAACWRKFALCYLVGLYHHFTKDYFDLGSAFHALMEGMSPERVGQLYPEQLTEAQRLEAIRRTKGPPLGKAVAIEREHILFDAKMTSKPDREEEAGVARDYKTAFNFSDHDQKKWDVAGGIIGEGVAARVTTMLVDITSKRRGKGSLGETDKPVKIVSVQVTTKKAEALAAHVDDFWAQLEQRVRKVANSKHPTALTRAFPPNLNACVDHYGPCDYYEHCWGKPPESLLYRVAEKAPDRWVTGRDETPLKLPGKLTTKLVSDASTKLRKAWFKK